VYREEETGRYSPSFINAFSLLLGSYLAGPIIKGKAGVLLADSLRDRALATFRQAAALNANANKDDTQYADHKPIWISDR
jgi:hypothetical protein